MDKRSEERVVRVFPDYFRNFTLPEGAHEERIKVYRACEAFCSYDLGFAGSV